MNRYVRAKLLLATGCAAFLAAVATAQAPTASAPSAAGGPKYKNLQVLPKDIGQEQLIPIMKSFAQALGVRCVHCHVGEEGKPTTVTAK